MAAMPNRFRPLAPVFALSLAAGVLTLALLAKPAQAATTPCVGVLTGVHDNVVVPPGASCTLQSAQVMRNVRVQTDATLQANASRIGGSVLGPQVRQILLQFETRVGGDVRIKGADPGTTNGFDINVRVGGDARIEANQGRVFVDAAFVGGDLVVRRNISQGFLEVEFNTVGGNIEIEDNSVLSAMSILGNQVTENMQVSNNTGSGSKQVVNNRVVGTLQCFNNTPPFVGGPNAAQSAQGQCF